MKKKLSILLILLLLIVIALGAVFFEPVTSYLKNLEGFRKVNQGLTDLIVQVDKTIIAPTPLRGSLDSNSAVLTADGVLFWTNNQRLHQGLPAVTINQRLNAAAQAKLDDLFANQYFEHVSSEGYGPDHWVNQAGYAYITIGENLALGNYDDDQALVQAWMDSPGHRANILSTSFTEIGIAVRKSQFEGQLVWIAVQEFGKPLSACPNIDESLKEKIATNQQQLDGWQTELDTLQERLKKERPPRSAGPEEVEAYNELVHQYNELASQYNALATAIKNTVEAYNQQVQTFNQCAN